MRLLAAAAYRLGIGPRPSDRPDRDVVATVAATPPGRALDLGCDGGRNALHLARHGWQVTGVDLDAGALAAAGRRAAEAGVDIRLVRGDVTRLVEAIDERIAELNTLDGDPSRFVSKAPVL